VGSMVNVLVMSAAPESVDWVRPVTWPTTIVSASVAALEMLSYPVAQLA
jgi:hypothetical protein